MEEKRKREAAEREKGEMEERIRKLEQELHKLTTSSPITSLASLSCRIPSSITRSGNQLTGGNSNCSCVFGDPLTSV